MISKGKLSLNMLCNARMPTPSKKATAERTLTMVVTRLVPNSTPIAPSSVKHENANAKVTVVR